MVRGRPLVGRRPLKLTLDDFMRIRMGETKHKTLEEIITGEIHRFVHEFQNIAVSYTPDNKTAPITVFVHPPYMLQCVSLLDDVEKIRNLKEKHQTRLQNVKYAREAANVNLKKFLNKWFYYEDGKERGISCGRARKSEIRQFLQEAIDARVVPISSNRSYRKGRELREWLKKYGIGVDCSGFAQQVLMQLLEFLKAENISSSKSEVGFLRCRWVYREITESQEQSQAIFAEVATPSQAKPGDVLVNTHHMRVIVQIEEIQNEGIIFELAESTSASDVPSGYKFEDDDIGPRRIQIKYPKIGQPISNQTPQMKRLIDPKFVENRDEKAYVIGRWRELVKIWHHSRTRNAI